MKALHNFNNEDKGRAIFELFPQLIPELVKHLADHCEYLVNNRQEIATTWPKDHFVTFDFWVSVADDTAHIIELKQKLLCKNMRLFLYEFFNTSRFLLVMDFIMRFSPDLINNPRYTLAVQLFFGQ